LSGRQKLASTGPVQVPAKVVLPKLACKQFVGADLDRSPAVKRQREIRKAPHFSSTSVDENQKQSPLLQDGSRGFVFVFVIRNKQ
jgi:hypothetical protein